MLENKFISRSSLAFNFFFAAVMLLMVNSLITELRYEKSGWEFKEEVRFLSALLAILSFLISGSRIKFTSIFLLSGCAIYTIISSNPDMFSFMFILIFVIAGAQLNDKGFLNACFYASAITFILIFIFLLAGVTEQYVREFRSRTTFGLNGIGGPTLFFNYFFGFSALAILKYRASIASVMFILALNWYFFLATDSRAGALSILILVLLCTILKPLINARINAYLIGTMPVLFLIIAFLLPFFLDNAFGNLILSNRPALFASLFSDLTFIDYLVGKSIKSYDLFAIIDNSFLHLFVGLGALMYLIICSIFFQSVKRLYSQKRFLAVAFIISTVCYANMESILVRPENAFVLYFWYLILNYFLSAKNINPSR